MLKETSAKQAAEDERFKETLKVRQRAQDLEACFSIFNSHIILLKKCLHTCIFYVSVVAGMDVQERHQRTDCQCLEKKILQT